MVKREQIDDRTVRIAGEKCAFLYRRLRPGVVLIEISGHDDGELGTSTLDELREDLSRFAPVELFVDAVDTSRASVQVSEMWTEWFSENRSALKNVSILVRSKYLHFTMEVAKLFSRTGELIRIYLDPRQFEEALVRAVPGFSRLPQL